MVVGTCNAVDEVRFKAMGTTAHVAVTGAPSGLVDHARLRIAELEGRWSRFLPESELNQLNRRSGAPVVVSPLTFELIERACGWWRTTNGVFDPTILPALLNAGYDREFNSIPRRSRIEPDAPGSPSPGCAEIELDARLCSVRLPAGVQIDLGGIAKGFAADVVAQELMDEGAGGACVNLGGDLRVMGEAPTGAAWVVSIDAEMPDSAAPPSLALMAGAIATSSRARRTWQRGKRTYHHLIDPRTGSPAETSFVATTIVTGRAVDAEALAKATLLIGDTNAAAELFAEHGACGLFVDASGSFGGLGGIDAFLVR
jgi:FAD:protein FMN transferase